MNHKTLPDTRPYPADVVKNELLIYAEQLANPTSNAQKKISQEGLQLAIYRMLNMNHYTELSVAMTMAPNVGAYRALLKAIDKTVEAKTDEEVQWFALPVILVAGCKKESKLDLTAPSAELSACLANYPSLRPLVHATWLPHLVRDDELASINAGRWFKAKQNLEAAAELAAQLGKTESLPLENGQSVQVVYAMGYGSKEIQTALNQNLRDAGLPLMQAWQQALAQPGVTLFTNPLAPSTPLHALSEGSHMRLRMALDVFAANAIRAIRLQSPRVGVVMAAQQGSNLLFGFNATESQFELQPQVFTWPLMQSERIEIIQQNFLDLMAECQVETIRLLHEPLVENEDLPNYAEALKLPGHNPLFGDGADA